MKKRRPNPFPPPPPKKNNGYKYGGTPLSGPEPNPLSPQEERPPLTPCDVGHPPLTQERCRNCGEFHVIGGFCWASTVKATTAEAEGPSTSLRAGEDDGR